MPESKIIFNCQTQDCDFKSADISDDLDLDGDIVNYNCPDCGQSYLINKNGEIHKLIDQLVFESFDGYREFTDKNASARLFISELILKNLKSNDFPKGRMEFKSCIISSLVIENLDLYASRSPLNFVDCYIERLYISNSEIERENLEDSLEIHAFFGINFIRSSIIEEFEITEVKSNICISDSVVECPIRVEKSMIFDFGLFHNQAAISIETDDLSDVHIRNSELIGDLPKVDVLDLIYDKAIQGVEIQELSITPDIKGEIKLIGVHIKKIIFQNDCDVHARINFEDCMIDEIINCPKDFKEDVQFYNCTFSTKVNFSGCIFQKSFTAEACTFKENLMLYEVTVQDNIQLNYSLFEAGVEMNESRFLASVYMYFIMAKGDVLLGNLLIHKDILIYADLFESLFRMDYCEVRGAVILSMTDFKEKASLYDIIAKELKVNLSEFNDETNLSYQKTEEIFVVNSVFFQDLSMIENTGIKNLFINGSLFLGGLNMMLCEINLYFLNANSFYESIDHYHISVKKNAYVTNNLFGEDAEFTDCEGDEFKVDKNFFLKELNFDRSEIEYLKVFDNKVVDLIIDSGIYNKIDIEANTILSWGKIYMITCNNQLSLGGNEYWGLSNDIISCTFNGNVQMSGNYFKGELYLSKNVAHQDFEFVNNQIDKDGVVRAIRNDFYNFDIEGSDFFAPLLMYDNRFQAKLSIGSQPGKGSSKRAVFHFGASLSNNRIRTFNMFNAGHAEAFCFMNNHLEGDFYLKEGYFKKELDLSGTYIGGSVKINNIGGKYFSGNLILDDVFVDKRISLNNAIPNYISFVDAKLNGLNIPDNWQMIWFKLKDTLNGKYIIADDANKKLNPENPALSYQLIKTYFQKEHHDFINTMQTAWDYLHTNVFAEEKSEKLKQKIENFYKLLNYRELISEILKQEFMTVYYGIVEEGGLESILDLGAYFETYNLDSDDPEISEGLKDIKDFFELFIIMCESFRDRKVHVQIPQVNFKQFYKRTLRSNLMNQYLTLRQIYAENGELGNEDKAYFKWMHYKTLLQMSRRKPFAKTISVLKLLVFETIFGWGVALWRIVISTIATVFLFSGIYSILFVVSPSFKMQWDGAHMPAGTIGYAKILLFSLQTTFGAFTGDWAPIGSIGIKLLMTINTVLGVLFVTFLIGAYGRKMLR